MNLFYVGLGLYTGIALVSFVLFMKGHYTLLRKDKFYQKPNLPWLWMALMGIFWPFSVCLGIGYNIGHRAAVREHAVNDLQVIRDLVSQFEETKTDG